MPGKTEIVVSGIGLTNSFVYTGKCDTLNFVKTAVIIECVHLGSGAQYTIRGYPRKCFAKTYSITSGTITTSGESVLKVFSDPYEQIDIVLKAVQSNRSGAVTVYVTRSRR